ncbi:MAG TPA: LLM class F420-dependent oxidoreductase [Candidatus Binatia bacterium]|nr:LLM class F420-dependent oxidoreductase [Candidatus Binatia bacterium]
MLQRITFKTNPADNRWDDILRFWTEADAIDVLDGGFLFDHFYPIYGNSSGPCFEGWTALSYLAGVTRRLRLGLMVTAVPYRHPGLLAKMASTFDVVSGGRLDLGLGAGWMQEEADNFGIPLLPIKQRLDQFEEAVTVLDSMLRNETTTFDGRHYKLENARCEPKGPQKPRPPFVIGGLGEKRMLKLCARWADDWNFVGGPADMFREKVEILHGHCESVGRDPKQITLSSHVFASQGVEMASTLSEALVGAGCQHLCLYFTDCSNPDQLGQTVEAVVKAVGKPA